MNVRVVHNFTFANSMEVMGWLKQNPHRTLVKKERMQDGRWYIVTDGILGGTVTGEKKKGKKK